MEFAVNSKVSRERILLQMCLQGERVAVEAELGVKKLREMFPLIRGCTVSSRGKVNVPASLPRRGRRTPL